MMAWWSVIDMRTERSMHSFMYILTIDIFSPFFFPWYFVMRRVVGAEFHNELTRPWEATSKLDGENWNSRVDLGSEKNLMTGGICDSSCQRQGGESICRREVFQVEVVKYIWKCENERWKVKGVDCASPGSVSIRSIPSRPPSPALLYISRLISEDSISQAPEWVWPMGGSGRKL